jgi:hypothetical protein
MHKRITTLLLSGVFLLSLHTVTAAPVHIHEAKKAAACLWQIKAPQPLIDISNFLVLQDVFVDNNDTLLYVFGYSSAGFVFIAGDDKVKPVLAYSFESAYNAENIHPAVNEWINFLLKEIRYAKTDEYIDIIDARSEWVALLNGIQVYDNSKTQNISPLILTTWDQGTYYNELCPYDPDGPGWRAYAGCVATMMAQVINYYRHPLIGSSQNGYYSNYGYLSVNFSQSNYDYFSMPKKLNSQNPAVAKLIYDCGIASNMNYSAYGSGAYMGNARDAMVQNFGYSNLTSLLYKGSYSNTVWINMLLDELDNKRPVMYAGYPSSGAGHAFVLDGYQQGDFFHFNWGWSGSYDGYFLLTALTPAGKNFSSGQSAIMKAYPAGVYPSYCNGDKVVTGVKGMVFDGSGPNNYANNSECTWLLSPDDTVTSVTLSFDCFNTESTNDRLIIYSGPDTLSSVVTIVSGDTLPSSLTIQGSKVLLRFISDSNTTGKGFDISFSWALQMFCSGTSLLNDPSGSFSDGSGQNEYRAGTFCKWLIEPPGAESITLSFTNFDTEDGADLVRIYNPTTVPSTLLATYSGNGIPPPVTTYSGKMLLIFQANQSFNDLGWEAVYTSTPVNVVTHNAENQINVYPIPASEQVYVLFRTDSHDNINFSLYDTYGRLYIKGNETERKAGDELIIPVNELKNGIYFLRLETGPFIINRKVIVAN